MMGTSHNTTAAAWACLRKGMLGVGAVLAVLGAPGSKAGYVDSDEVTYDNCQLIVPPLHTIVAHEVGTFSKSTDKEEFIPDQWIDLSHEDAWICTRYSNHKTVEHPKAGSTPRLAVGLDTVIDHESYDDIDFGGHKYTIYESSGDKDQRIGYILHQRLHLKYPGASGDDGVWLPSKTGWKPVHREDDGKIRTTDNGGADAALYLTNGTTYIVAVQTQIRLLKVTNKFPKTGEAIEFEAARLRYWTEDKFNGRTQPGPSGAPPAQSNASRPARHSRVRVWFNRNDKTCTTPSQQPVDLPTALVNQFSGLGSFAGTKDFTLELTGCSSGISAIEYKLLPSQREITDYPNIQWLTTHANGTLPLSNGSTATNVAIQVLAKNNSGTFVPVTFDRDTRLSVSSSDYTPGAPTASIPLQARYIQTTDADPTVGDVFATMKVLYMYK